jgi:TRAP-type C4-dicarboxylate transport system permease small subunit
VPVLVRLSGRINQWIEYLVVGLGVSMALLVAVQVFFRYILNQSLFWSEEMARYFLVWLTFLGATAAYYRHAHPGVDVLYNRMSPKLQIVCSLFTHTVSFGLFAIMVIYGCQFAYFVKLQTTPALQIPKWIVLSIIPISGLIFMIHNVRFVGDVLKRCAHDR